jgi:hypothetical protein
MSRDHYKGARKRRAALIGADGDLEALELGGDPKVIYGTATLSAGTITVSDSRFKATSFAIVSGKHPYPLTDGINWSLSDGSLTISGTGSNVVSYQVVV